VVSWRVAARIAGGATSILDHSAHEFEDDHSQVDMQGECRVRSGAARTLGLRDKIQPHSGLRLETPVHPELRGAVLFTPIEAETFSSRRKRPPRLVGRFYRP
jgi:hypothetical protein